MTFFQALSSRERRVVSLGAGAIVFLVLVGRGVPMWRRWAIAARADAVVRVRALAESESLVGTGEATSDSLEARSHRLAALRSTLLVGDSPTAAAAQLASIVSASAARSSVQLGAMDIHADSARSRHLPSVRVRLSGTGDIAGLTQFVGLLESAPTRCVIRSFAITQSDPVGSSAQPEVLHVDMVVEGLAANIADGVSR